MHIAMTRRRFSDEQKLEILQEAEKMGVTAVLRLHSLSYSVFAKWREKFRNPGTTKQEAAISNKARSELKQFIEENARLKKIIADQALELERKDEELKKSMSSYGKR
jgi:putative transposase